MGTGRLEPTAFAALVTVLHVTGKAAALTDCGVVIGLLMHQSVDPLRWCLGRGKSAMAEQSLLSGKECR